MALMACVNIPELPLQMALRGRVDSGLRPVVVVDKLQPTGRVLWANEAARACRILPGTRYVAGLALANDLVAEPFSETELDRELARLIRRLGRFSPKVEPREEEPGVFWLDVSRLRRIYASGREWVEAVTRDLGLLELEAVVAVGWTRFGVYAAAKASTRHRFFETEERERRWVREVPLERLALEPELRERLDKLGIRDVGAFVDLPALGLRKRFGEAAVAWHTWARDTVWETLRPATIREPILERREFELPEWDQNRLLSELVAMTRALIERHRAHGETPSALRLALALDDGARLEERVVAAEPTSALAQWESLLRLRLESLTLSDGANTLSLRAEVARVSTEQLGLFQQTPKRDLKALGRAYARLRAEFGEGILSIARLRDGHLPSARYVWEPFERFSEISTARRPEIARLIRRIYAPAKRLGYRSRQVPQGRIRWGNQEEIVEETRGPFRLEGGWWRGGVARDYYYLRLRSARWLWVYYDARRSQWYLQGEVE